ncbi:ABC transporter permease subunit [Neptunomonas phycophila]|uniref:ABC transporter permease subunit n=1 Tax=Neptunomonas phycophila TaxID=1572645 RepID=UPI001FF067D0|nr:ABC transporter permease subunit [Neptunomonas phycophila]
MAVICSIMTLGKTSPAKKIGFFSLNRLCWLSYPVTLLVTLLAFYGLMSFEGDSADWQLLTDSYFLGVLGFTLKQSTISSFASVLFAIPIARALNQLNAQRFKNIFLGLCLLCFVTPTLVVVTGLVALLGRSGWLTPYIESLVEDYSWNLYGLNGILLAHLFMNMPFAIRIIHQQLATIPDTSWRLAKQLKLSPWQRFVIIEKPVIQSAGLMLFGFIFVLCFNSFAVVLALGGGPQSTTLEVAVYQALKYDFNISEALTLAWSQLLIAGGLYACFSAMGTPVWQSHEVINQTTRPYPLTIQASRLRLLALCGVSILLLLPYVALLPSISLFFTADIWRLVMQPLLLSIGLGMTSASISLVMAYTLLQPIRSQLKQKRSMRVKLLEQVATHQLFAPAMVISVGLFVFLLPRVDLDRWGIIVVILLNSAVLVPFAFQKLKPRLIQFDQQYDRLCLSLKLNTWERWKIEWAFIRPSFISAASLVFVLAAGDVAIFAIFGPSDWSTLPWLIYSLAGTYRIPEASAASLLLLLVCAGALWLLQLVANRTAVSSVEPSTDAEP